MVMEDLGSGQFGQRVSTVLSGAIGQGRNIRATVTVGAAVVSLAAPAGPASSVAPTAAWRYLKVTNKTANTVLSVAINADPTASAADPPSAVQWGVGYDVLGGASEMIPIIGTLTTIRLMSDTSSTGVVLDLIA